MKEHFFEIRRKVGDEQCKACGFPILDHSCWYAGDVQGPFCRPECAAKANELKGKMKVVRPT